MTLENVGEKHDKASGKPYKLTPCIASENNWNTKEDKGSTMMNDM